ncbi:MULTISPECIES: TRAP transporter small permease [unclassified Jeotgalibaca]|uniref:TRAP transporter small permease n=1 Tax=unclassified Jeotgalibaca TaxID=2621505 RepID=UPI003FD40EF9
MKLLKILNEKGEEILMSFSLWGIVLIMGLQITLRYVFGEALAWPEELSRYLFIWFTFLGMSYSIKNKSHIRIDMLELSVPKLQKPLEMIGDAIFFVFAIIMLQPGMKVISILFNTNQTSPGLQLPMYLVYGSVFVGFILVIVRLIQKYARLIIVRSTAQKTVVVDERNESEFTTKEERLNDTDVVTQTGGRER